MKLLFKQRLFKWLDSYDIYNEHEEVVYTVEGQLAWGHKLKIYNHLHEEVGEVIERIVSFLPQFTLIEQGKEVGWIKKEFSFFKPKFQISCNDWIIEGDIWEWEYDVNSIKDGHIMHASKEIFRLSDTYVLNVECKEDELLCLMIVLVIDAIKCSQG